MRTLGLACAYLFFKTYGRYRCTPPGYASSLEPTKKAPLRMTFAIPSGAFYEAQVLTSAQ
jgi:hypothetical protein